MTVNRRASCVHHVGMSDDKNILVFFFYCSYNGIFLIYLKQNALLALDRLHVYGIYLLYSALLPYSPFKMYPQT